MTPDPSTFSLTSQPSAVVLMGVCGCGKTEVGQLLATRTGGEFFDADHYHTQENIAKMGAGKPLNDDDRWPWLERLRTEVLAPAVLDKDQTRCRPVFLGCSALRRAYREALTRDLDRHQVVFVLLSGSSELILERMRARKGHYMKEEMLESQTAILEVPTREEHALTVSIDATVQEIAGEIIRLLGLRTSDG